MQLKNNKIKQPLQIRIQTQGSQDTELVSEGSLLNMKRLSSSRHINHSKFDFDLESNQNKKILHQEVRKSKTMEKANEFLIKSLIALKTGAVSIIAQKQKEIDDLKSDARIEEQLTIIEQELRELYDQRQELKSIITDLEQKIESQRLGFTRMLEEKERLIEQLYSQVECSQYQIENLQKNESIKERKLKIIQEQNINLFQQLQEQKFIHLSRQSKITDSEEHQNCPQQILQTSFLENSHKRMTSTVQSQSINQVQLKHREEFNQLAIFYEKRLSEIRQLYQKQLNLSNSSKQPHYELIYINDCPTISKKDTIVAPKKLSMDLINQPQLSNCCSQAKINLSKFDSLSLYSIEKGILQSEDKFSIRIKAIKKDQNKDENKTEVTEQKKKPFILQSSVKRKISLEKSKPLNFTQTFKPFLLGAMLGGILMTAICKSA